MPRKSKVKYPVERRFEHAGVEYLVKIDEPQAPLGYAYYSLKRTVDGKILRSGGYSRLNHRSDSGLITDIVEGCKRAVQKP